MLIPEVSGGGCEAPSRRFARCIALLAPTHLTLSLSHTQVASSDSLQAMGHGLPEGQEHLNTAEAESNVIR